MTTSSTVPSFAQNDAKQSESIQIEQSSAELGSELPLSAVHWFTQLLPEGWCVGIYTGNDDVPSTMADERHESKILSDILLHADEYEWGMNNIASETSRSSYYLGRMALRLSLDVLLQNEGSEATQEKRIFYSELIDRIRSTAINKDFYGRPILPEIISGSISHKGGNAVGLARFRSSWDRAGDDQFETIDASAIQWREECPIIDDEDRNDTNVLNDVYCASSHATVRGVGVDLERVDGKRGKRIERKVLTERERIRLGGLEVRTLVL